MPASVMMSNVAGEAARLAIRQALVPWLAVLHEVESTASAGGVTNLYENPVRLGVDRWCALIGARAMTAAAVRRRHGRHRDDRRYAGWRRPFSRWPDPARPRPDASLAGARHGGSAAGRRQVFRVYPRCTDDAITSGCIEAQVGAIERACGRLGADARCLLSGGAAGVIGEHLGVPHVLVANLVLEGLLRLAGESPAAHAAGKISG